MDVVIPLSEFKWILPEIVLTAWALLLLVIGAFGRSQLSAKVSGVICLLGALTTLYTTVCLWGTRLDVFNKLYTIDDYGTFFKVIFLIVLSLITILSIKYGEREEIASGEYYSLLMFGVLGMMVMVSSHSFVTIFIGLEVMSLSIYILCGLMRKNANSVEASLKYFLLGAFATAFLLYGMALIYGATGLIDVAELKAYLAANQPYEKTMFFAGMALLIVGFGFKTTDRPGTL